MRSSRWPASHGSSSAWHLTRSSPTCRSLPSLWNDAGPEGRQALASALFTKLEVEGYTKMRYQLTPDAVTLGLGAALPAQTETGGHTGGFGRGERGSASLAHLRFRPQFVLENVTPAAQIVARCVPEGRLMARQRPTRRQLEVLRAYIATGSITAAAHDLDIVESTARQHLSGLYRRTGCVNAVQAAYLLGRSEHAARR